MGVPAESDPGNSDPPTPPAEAELGRPTRRVGVGGRGWAGGNPVGHRPYIGLTVWAISRSQSRIWVKTRNSA